MDVCLLGYWALKGLPKDFKETSYLFLQLNTKKKVCWNFHGTNQSSIPAKYRFLYFLGGSLFTLHSTDPRCLCPGFLPRSAFSSWRRRPNWRSNQRCVSWDLGWIFSQAISKTVFIKGVFRGNLLILWFLYILEVDICSQY